MKVNYETSNVLCLPKSNSTEFIVVQLKVRSSCTMRGRQNTSLLYGTDQGIHMDLEDEEIRRQNANIGLVTAFRKVKEEIKEKGS